MKRDIELMRKLLLEIEKSPASGIDARSLHIESRTEIEIEYNLILMQDARMIEGYDCKDGTKPATFYVTRITWDGHEFLDAARNDMLWKKAKEMLLRTAGVVTVEGLKVALTQLSKGKKS